MEVHYCPVLIISISYQVSQLLANTRHGSAAAATMGRGEYYHNTDTGDMAAPATGFCVERGEEVITLIISSICHHTTPALDTARDRTHRATGDSVLFDINTRTRHVMFTSQMIQFSATEIGTRKAKQPPEKKH